MIKLLNSYNQGNQNYNISSFKCKSCPHMLHIILSKKVTCKKAKNLLVSRYEEKLFRVNDLVSILQLGSSFLPNFLVLANVCRRYITLGREI